MIRPFRFVSRTSLTLLSLATLALALFSFSQPAAAQSFRSGTDVTIGDTVDSTLYASGQTVDISGRVNGDVICAGQNVTISGTVQGDVICAAQTLRITGTVEGDVRLAGQSTSIEGAVGGNASVFSQTLSISGGGSVAGDIGGFAQTATVNGRVGRDLAINSTFLTLNSAVGRNVNANAAQQLKLGSGARISGDVKYVSNSDIQRDNGAQVDGRVDRNQPSSNNSNAGQGIALALYILLAMLIISMVLVLIMPKVFQKASNQALKMPGKTVLVGLALSIIVPAVLVILSITVIGLPLALIGVLIWILALTLAGPTSAYLLGRAILRSSDNAIIIMLVGSLVLLVAYLIPLVNIIALAAAMWFGLGSLALALPKYSHKGYRVRSTNEVLETKKAKNND